MYIIYLQKDVIFKANFEIPLLSSVSIDIKYTYANKSIALTFEIWI